MAGEAKTATAEREIVLTRLLDAPRELVWRALTEPEHLIRWWGPNGFTNTFHEIDVREGGVWRFVMHGPDGSDYDNFVRFIEVVPPERLVYDHGVSENDVMFQACLTLDEVGDGTVVTLRTVFPSVEARDRAIKEVGAIEGGNQTLARLAAHLMTMTGEPGR
jgi:uncharacterized protein YndB with AHSA1/START domain